MKCYFPTNPPAISFPTSVFLCALCGENDLSALAKRPRYKAEFFRLTFLPAPFSRIDTKSNST